MTALRSMPTLPRIDPSAHTVHSPHLFILGAGASRASTPNGDLYGQRLPLMKDLVELVELEPLLEEAAIPWKGRDFEQLYEGLLKGDENRGLLLKIEEKIASFFRSLCLPAEPTDYDYLLLALREKDVIATFNWDPLLAQAFQRNVKVKRLPQILFLHGNVAIGMCVSCKSKGFFGNVCRSCEKPFAMTRLLYPTGQKDYDSDPFIKNEWEALRKTLSESYMLTIFGYSAPVSDEAAVALLRAAWNTNASRELAQIEIIDRRPEEDIQASWKSFITRNHYSISKSIHETWALRHPRRSCEALFWATMQQAPWKRNTLPHQFASLQDLQQWISPLLAEEESDRIPFRQDLVIPNLQDSTPP
jgi:NAD-dependent SIR2 family protein deacetylase